MYQAIEAAASLKVPVQVHTGFGDVDLRLDQSNPLLFLEAIRFADQRGVPLVLLHTSYPFCREASFLCANYACIHLDLSLAIPLLSWAGMTEAVAQCMHLAPIWCVPVRLGVRWCSCIGICVVVCVCMRVTTGVGVCVHAGHCARACVPMLAPLALAARS